MLSWHGQVRVRQRGMTLKIPQTNPRYQTVTGNTLCLLSGPLIYKILRLMGFQRETRYALNMDSMSGVHATCLFCMWILSKEFGVFGLGKWFFCCWFITGIDSCRWKWSTFPLITKLQGYSVHWMTCISGEKVGNHEENLVKCSSSVICWNKISSQYQKVLNFKAVQKCIATTLWW